MKIEVSIAEIVDKLSILEIKKNKIHDSNKLINIKKEYDYLKNIVFNELKIEIIDYADLSEINLRLWNIEENNGPINVKVIYNDDKIFNFGNIDPLHWKMVDIDDFVNAKKMVVTNYYNPKARWEPLVEVESTDFNSIPPS